MRGIIRSEITQLLKPLANERALAKRIELISAQFLGLPYVENSLGGGAGMPEQLTVMFDGFDCVTYMETVLALALSETTDEFAEQLIRLRYKKGIVSWQARNHYMVDWWRNNEKQGLVKNVTRGNEAVETIRTVNVIEGLPEKSVKFLVFPPDRFPYFAERIATGDLVCFASEKPDLDVFHTGLLVRREDDILLRHATRTAGKVIEQSLEEFLQNTQMSGLVLLRPSN